VFLKKLFKVGVVIKPLNQKKQNLKFLGQVFVLTGTLSSLSRLKAKEMIRELGGDISESVSSATSFLVAGENPGSKFDRAKKLKIPVLNEKEFLLLIK
jgi:DNA ligase (NAD+)